MTGPTVASLVCTPLYFRRCRIEGKQAPGEPFGNDEAVPCALLGECSLVRGGLLLLPVLVLVLVLSCGPCQEAARRADRWRSHRGSAYQDNANQTITPPTSSFAMCPGTTTCRIRSRVQPMVTAIRSMPHIINR